MDFPQNFELEGRGPPPPPGGDAHSSKALLSIAPSCPNAHAIMFCMEVLFNGFETEVMEWKWWTWKKIPWNSIARFPGSWQDLGHLSRNFGAFKDWIESDEKRDIIAMNCNRNEWCIFLTLLQDLDLKKKWLGPWHVFDRNRVKLGRVVLPSFVPFKVPVLLVLAFHVRACRHLSTFYWELLGSYFGAFGHQ